jgi:hypothetical protein
VDVFAGIQPVALGGQHGFDEFEGVTDGQLLADPRDGRVDDVLARMVLDRGRLDVAFEIVLPIAQCRTVIGHQAIGVFTGDLGIDVLVEISRPLDRGGVRHFLLEDGDLLEAHRFGQRIGGILGVEVVALAHQLDFAGHVQAGYQQDNFPLRFPAPGDAREAIDDIGQQHALDAGLEVQVLAQLLDGEGVALLPIQIESLLANVVCGQDGLDFSDGIVLPALR